VNCCQLALDNQAPHEITNFALLIQSNRGRRTSFTAENFSQVERLAQVSRWGLSADQENGITFLLEFRRGHLG